MRMETDVLSISSPNLEWVNDSPATLACRQKTPAGTTSLVRRTHKKSRLGCGNCKRRRVKCDESKPKCVRCIQQRIACDYLKLPAPSDTGSESSSSECPWSSAIMASMGSNLVESQLQGFVKHIKPRMRNASSSWNAGGSLVEILHHFEYIAWSTVGISPQIQQDMRTTVLSLAQDSPFLMTAIFAFSVNHLHTLRPDDATTQITAAYHRQTALQLYCQELSCKLTPSKVDSMIAACLLLSTIVFFTEDSSPSTSFLFSDDPKTADWLHLVAGLAGLLSRDDTKDVISQSIWPPILTGNANCIFTALEGGKNGLPEPFVELCHIRNDSTADNNPYHSELSLLTQMMGTKADKETFANMVQFPCRMNPAFNALLREKDPVALLILAYWFAKLLEVDFWWLGTRARSECYAICSWLDGWPDERFQPLLQYPMQACGYVPLDLDVIQMCVFSM